MSRGAPRGGRGARQQALLRWSADRSTRRPAAGTSRTEPAGLLLSSFASTTAAGQQHAAGCRRRCLGWWRRPAPPPPCRWTLGCCAVWPYSRVRAARAREVQCSSTGTVSTSLRRALLLRPPRGAPPRPRLPPPPMCYVLEFLNTDNYSVFRTYGAGNATSLMVFLSPM